MNGFEAYIKELLSERGINEHDKKDLEFEIEDHLLLLKNEYVDKGLSEKDAIKSSIKDFGESNFIGNSIKNNLPSHNKFIDFSSKERMNCLLEMFLIYFVFKFIGNVEQNAFSNGIVPYVIMTIPVVCTSFVFVNKKIKNEKNKVKNLFYCNILFFILEKIIMSGYGIFRLIIVDKISASSDIINPTKSLYLFDLQYIITFLLATLCSIILTKLLGDKLLKGIKNTYNYSLKSTVISITSILLMLLYLLTLNTGPYSLGLITDRIQTITGFNILSINGNPLFAIINNKLIVPNIGLLILIMLFIRLIIRVRKKGLKSIL
jgi:hypothetical protein